MLCVRHIFRGRKASLFLFLAAGSAPRRLEGGAWSSPGMIRQTATCLIIRPTSSRIRHLTSPFSILRNPRTHARARGHGCAHARVHCRCYLPSPGIALPEYRAAAYDPDAGAIETALNGWMTGEGTQALRRQWQGDLRLFG
jgi:hypothetical protein